MIEFTSKAIGPGLFFAGRFSVTDSSLKKKLSITYINWDCPSCKLRA